MIRFLNWIKRKRLAIKGPSLTVKWALASSFFIFVVFTVFAVFTYKTSSHLMIGKEKNNLIETMNRFDSRLMDIQEELNFKNTIEAITETDAYDLTKHQELTQADNISLNTFIPEFSQPDLKVYVYNLAKELVFKSQGTAIPLKSTEELEPTVVSLEDKSGFLVVTPLHSRLNHELIGYSQAFYDLTPFFDIQHRLLVTLIILEVISLVLSSILGFFLSSYFLKPVKVLRDTMDTIRKDPQSLVEAPVLQTHDELSDLSEIFNEMMARMRRYIEQQEQFVQDVSHELRTPVAIIEGHLKLLERWGKDDPEVLEESLNASLQEISRMKMLVQEMLDLSRAEQVDIKYYDKTSKAKEVVHQIYNNFKLLYPEFKFTLDDELLEEEEVAIYRNHFEQMMIIILDNAVKYSTKRKEVHISMAKGSRYLELALQDFGEGIPKEDLGKIFDRFYRVDKARSRNQGGNGLGLSIAKQLIDNYKGKILAESVVGYGTVFRIFIPLVLSEEKNAVK